MTFDDLAPSRGEKIILIAMGMIFFGVFAALVWLFSETFFG